MDRVWTCLSVPQGMHGHDLDPHGPRDLSDWAHALSPGPGIDQRMTAPLSIVRTHEGFLVTRETHVPMGLRLESAATVTLAHGVHVDGHIRVAGSLLLQNDARVGGRIEAGGDVVIGPGSRIGGDIEARGDIRILPGATVHGDVKTEGDVHIYADSTVQGTTRAGGDITVHGAATTGPLHPTGRLASEAFDESVPADA